MAIRQLDALLSAESRLSQHLGGLTRSEMAALSDQAGVPRRIGFRARNGHTVSATAYLLLCMAMGTDPSTGSMATKTPRRGASVAWSAFGSALFLTRSLRQLDLRKAAQRVGVSAATLSRAEHGRPTAVESYLRIAGFIGVPAQGFLCFTANSDCNTLIRNDFDILPREQSQPWGVL
jgi:hypothetical protein